MASSSEPAILEVYNQTQEQLQAFDDVYTEYHSSSPATSLVDPAILEEYAQIQEQVQGLSATATTSLVDSSILEEYTKIQEMLQGLDNVNIEYYSAQVEDNHSGEPLETNITEDGDTEKGEDTGKKETAKKQKKSGFLAKIQKPWKWIVGLKKRGSYVINEDPATETPGPSHMDTRGDMSSTTQNKDVEPSVTSSGRGMSGRSRSEQDMCSDRSSSDLNPPEELCRSASSSQSSRCPDIKSTTSETSVEDADTSAGASVATVPLSQSTTAEASVEDAGTSAGVSLSQSNTAETSVKDHSTSVGSSVATVPLSQSTTAETSVEDAGTSAGVPLSLSTAAKTSVEDAGTSDGSSAATVPLSQSTTAETTVEDAGTSAGSFVAIVPLSQAGTSAGVPLSQSTTAESSVEHAGTSAGSSVATVPLSLRCFNFHRILGEGAFGNVYLATDVIRKECVAIKPVYKRVYTFWGYSLEERNVLQISHGSPYLIHGLAAFHTSRFVYYVMELAARGNLQNLIDNTYLGTASTFIAAEVVCGIQFLHKQGFIHRDLKPLNLLLTAEGHIKIADFGLAVRGASNGTNSSSRGTAGYAAPEMILGLHHGRGVDYFALGAILYRLLTRQRAFPGDNGSDREQSVLHRTPIYPRFLTVNQVSILEGLLCKNQYQRLGVNDDIRSHPFFSDVNWEDVEARRMEPPAILKQGAAVPDIEKTLDYKEPLRLGCIQQRMFQHFSFVCSEWSQHYHAVVKQTRSWLARLVSRLSCRK